MNTAPLLLFYYWYVCTLAVTPVPKHINELYRPVWS